MTKLKRQVPMGKGFHGWRTEQDYLDLITVPHHHESEFRLNQEQIEQAHQEMFARLEQQEQAEREQRFFTAKAMQEIVITF